MPKKTSKTVFVCQQCGYESPRWLGQCICGAWNSFVEEKSIPEEIDERSKGCSAPNEKRKAKPQKLSSVISGQSTRLDTGIKELNRVLGGGLVKGSLTLISGEPGIGKSTIIIQAASHICNNYGKVLYVSGEESEEQIKMRSDRVCKEKTEELYVLSETCMESVINAIDDLKPSFLIIDSIQTMYTEDFDSAPGSVSQVRACGNLLMNIGKGRDLPIFIVAHVTKSGELAGPKIVEHMVDTVLQFNGERSQDLRILRSLKNRFGTTSEIGAFEMREEGLVEIENLSASFLEGLEDNSAGAVATAVYEGTRPLLLEIQALTSPTNIGFARRTAIGVENSRLGMIVAVLERKASVSLFNMDIYVNIVGGMKPEGTSTDLAVALSIWSDAKGEKLPTGFMAIGEIGLTGDLRPVQNAEKLIKEADRMGFTILMLPKRSVEKLVDKPKNLHLLGVTSLLEAIREASKIAVKVMH